MGIAHRLIRLGHTASTLSMKKLFDRVSEPLCAVDALRPSLQRAARAQAKQGGLPAWRQTCEMLELALRHGIEPDLYLRANLSRRHLSWEDKAAFLGTRTYRRLIDRVNPPAQRALATKYTSAALFRAFAIPTPETYACVGRGGVAFDGRRVGRVSELAQLVRDREITAACFKPVQGFGGVGFTRVEFKEEVDGLRCSVLPEGVSLDLDALWDRLGLDEGIPQIFQEAVVQHPELAEIHPESLNTARIWMERCDSGEWRMLVGVLRVGAGGSLVDNSSQGGLAAPIDLETGRLGDASRPWELVRVLFPQHPTTGAEIRGRVLPMWSEMPEFCNRLCMPFSPGLRLLGVDVAFAHDGLLAIEVNPRADVVHQVVLDHGFRKIVNRAARSARP